MKAPSYYDFIPGVQAKDFSSHLPADLAIAFNYIFRMGKKEDPRKDCRKALHHLQFRKDLLSKKSEIPKVDFHKYFSPHVAEALRVLAYEDRSTPIEEHIVIIIAMEALRREMEIFEVEQQFCGGSGI